MREVLSVTQAERDKAKKAGNSLPDGSYPINNAAQLHAAAVLAASHHGDWKAAMTLIRRRARELGVDVTTLPGFGSESKSADRAAFERRKRNRGNPAHWFGKAERRGLQIEMRTQPDGTGGTDFVFEGYGAVFDAPFEMFDRWGDPYTEVVKPGAFSRSLARRDLDVPFLIGHDEKRLALARTRNGTMDLSQDSRGLHVRAVMDGRRSDVRDLAYAVERGDTDEMSIGFVTLGQEWSPDYEVRSMLDLDLHRGDVSSVPLAANPAASGATMMSTLLAESLAKHAAERRAAMNAVADMHDHPHFHDGDADHDHDHDTVSSDTDNWGSRRPREHRGNPISTGLGDASDYDVYEGPLPHPPITGMHSHEHQSYGGDALVRINDDGVPAMTEEQGSAASLSAARALLETRRRQLDLLRLRG